ncbi:MAG: anion permease [Oscillospiraceae bacterium]|nr:anion permease [Oscillospiraceae bacterium]
MFYAAIAVFVLTYILLLLLPKHRAYVALGAAVVFIAMGAMPLSKAPGAISWNVIMMIAGTMGMVTLFIDSKMPDRMADMLLQKTKSVKMAVVALSVFSGFISAFMDNVATVLIVAPIGLVIARRIGVSPVPVIISISVSSNLQGAATLVGDTTSIMLGGYAGMDFLDFIVMNGRPGIFWAVELGAAATIPVLLYLFRNEKGSIEKPDLTQVEDLFPTFLLVATVVLLISASFIPNKPEVTNGVICVVLCAVGLIRSYFRSGNTDLIKKTAKEFDFQTLLLLCGMFIVVGSVTRVGLIDKISSFFVWLSGDSLFIVYTIIVFFSVLFSAFIDNIPYVATMLPVVQGIAAMTGSPPYLLYYGLLVGATLGGNLTPVGASANIAGIGILQKNGYDVSTKDFLRIGLPFTFAAVLVGYVFCWIFWAR